MAASNTIFLVFGMTRSGIESQLESYQKLKKKKK